MDEARRDGHVEADGHDNQAGQERVFQRRSDVVDRRNQADKHRSTHHQQARDTHPNRFRTRAAKEAFEQGETRRQDRTATHSEENSETAWAVSKAHGRDDTGAAKEESIHTHSQRAAPKLRALLGVPSPHEPGDDTRQMNGPRDAGYGQDRTDELIVAHHRGRGRGNFTLAGAAGRRPLVVAAWHTGYLLRDSHEKGNNENNDATEQVFGRLKDEFFRGQDWQTFESFKADLDAYITHWNTVRRQVKLKGLTPAEYRDQALREAA